jgi:hypothetical protein
MKLIVMNFFHFIFSLESFSLKYYFQYFVFSRFNRSVILPETDQLSLLFKTRNTFIV